MERVMKKNDWLEKAISCVALCLVMVVASGCGAETPKVIKASVSAEDQEAAESSISQHDSDDYAKSMSEQNGPR
ncbi:MAG: hypothetical protein CMM01_20125 [Rhodopirellula sp.]|nr:hypothetical protein [Rhodopirellula sp.]